MTDREMTFITELEALLERHGLTVEQHTFFDGTCYSEDWAFTGEDFDLDICDAAEWLKGRRCRTLNEGTSHE